MWDNLCHPRLSFLTKQSLNTLCTDVATTENYKKTMTDFYTRTSEYQKKASSLEAKVKKWQNRPAEIDELAGRQKELACTLHVGAVAFQLSAKKGPNADKMEQVLRTLKCEGLEAGLAQLCFVSPRCNVQVWSLLSLLAASIV